MKDPFFVPPIDALTEWVRPWAQKYHLTVLPQHIHEVIASALLYTFIHLVISPWVSNKYAAEHYPKSRGKRASWDSHVVSLFQSVLICVVALWVMFTDKERASMDWQARVWGYTGSSGMVQSLVVGYFLWDFCITVAYLDVFGLGLLAHAVSALSVYSLGYRPFLNYYATDFILYELSTPFLNVHWFFDKLGMTGTKAQLYNGIVLLFTFFSARLIWGMGRSVFVWYDIYRALSTSPNTEFMSVTPVNEHLPGSEDIMMYAKEAGPLPMWMAAVYMASNLTLNTLNIIWFGKMIKAVQKRFEPGAKDFNKEETSEKKGKLPPGASTANDIAGRIDELRRRHNLPEIEIKDDLADVQ